MLQDEGKLVDNSIDHSRKQGDILLPTQLVVLLQVTTLRQKMVLKREEVSDIDREVRGADLTQCLRLGGKVS